MAKQTKSQKQTVPVNASPTTHGMCTCTTLHQPPVHWEHVEASQKAKLIQLHITMQCPTPTLRSGNFLLCLDATDLQPKVSLGSPPRVPDETKSFKAAIKMGFLSSPAKISREGEREKEAAK